MDELLALLSADAPVSGESLCRRLGVTRAAIWKRIEKLRQEGYGIEAVGRRGYRLVVPPDSLLPLYVQRELQTAALGRQMIYERVLPSTNDTLKALLPQGVATGTLCVCERQTGGKGRMHRAWQAEEGESLLQSVLLRPRLAPENGGLCTLASAVAMARAIEEVAALPARIKWPNDIVIDGRKVVGILTEMAVNLDTVEYAIVGAGVNVNQRTFPPELAQKAASLAGLAGRPVDRRALLCRYLLRLEETMAAVESQGFEGVREAYLGRSATVGCRVRVESGLLGQTECWVGTATGIDPSGALLVTDEQGVPRPVRSADVSVRGVMGYVDV